MSVRDLRHLQLVQKFGSSKASDMAIALQEVIKGLESVEPAEDGSRTVTFGPAFLEMLKESMETS